MEYIWVLAHKIETEQENGQKVPTNLILDIIFIYGS